MQLKLNDKRTWVKGLLAECPFGFALPDCIFHALRRLPLDESIRRVNAMSDEEIGALIKYHRNCIVVCKGRENRL